MKSTAIQLCYDLEPYCEKINIVGSIRRRVTDPSNIDLLAVLKPVTVIELFGDSYTIPFANEAVLPLISRYGKIIAGSINGRLVKLDTNIVIYLPQRADYYRMYAVRTGGTDYAKAIAARWRRKGWCGTSDGLRLVKQCREIENTNRWICMNMKPTLPPVWDSEIEFFDWLELPFIIPQLR